MLFFCQIIIITGILNTFKQISTLTHPQHLNSDQSRALSSTFTSKTRPSLRRLSLPVLTFKWAKKVGRLCDLRRNKRPPSWRRCQRELYCTHTERQEKNVGDPAEDCWDGSYRLSSNEWTNVTGHVLCQFGEFYWIKSSIIQPLRLDLGYKCVQMFVHMLPTKSSQIHQRPRAESVMTFRHFCQTDKDKLK